METVFGILIPITIFLVVHYYYKFKGYLEERKGPKKEYVYRSGKKTLVIGSNVIEDKPIDNERKKD